MGRSTWHTEPQDIMASGSCEGGHTGRQESGIQISAWLEAFEEYGITHERERKEVEEEGGGEKREREKKRERKKESQAGGNTQ